MKTRMRVLAGAFALGALTLLSPGRSPACTSGCTRNLPEVGPIVMKSYDWDNRDGIVVLNQTHIHKTAVGVSNPKKWVSKYFSVTFNQWGMQMPMGGMNEKGLVVEIMKVGDFKESGTSAELAKRDFPTKKEGREALNQLQWVQYILDMAGDLDEAKTLAEEKVYAVPHFSVVGVKAFDIDPVHYLVCDVNAECRIFEYKRKKLLVTKKRSWDGLPTKTFAKGAFPFGTDHVSSSHDLVETPMVPVLANNYIYTDGMCLEKYLEVPDGTKCKTVHDCHEACKEMKKADSTRRFVFAAKKLNAVPAGLHTPAEAAHYGFEELTPEVCNGDTQWQIIYLPKSMDVYWKSIEDCKPKHKSRGHVNLHAAMDGAASCRTGKEIVVYDLDGSIDGEAYHKIKYPTLKYPTLTKINSQALYENFRHGRNKTPNLTKIKGDPSGAEADVHRSTALSVVQMTSFHCKKSD
ncbi:MAG: hypothetical protein HY611_06770 [Elusimicrobia bacterium]|nr:hypothetical protein [Elusimicrobiota bacterium]